MQDFNTRVIDEFHSKGGRGVGRWGDNLLLLTVRGARSGREITKPLAYVRDGERYVVVGSKGGAPTHPTWFHNVVAHRDVTVEVAGERFHARATPYPKGPERDRLFALMADRFPGFRDYETKTTRILPAVALERVKAEP